MVGAPSPDSPSVCGVVIICCSCGVQAPMGRDSCTGTQLCAECPQAGITLNPEGVGRLEKELPLQICCSGGVHSSIHTQCIEQ